MHRISIIIYLLAIVSGASAQLPQSNIYLFTFEWDADSIEITEAKYLSHFNANGYNNQPYFLEKDRILITSNYLQDDQTDIFELDLRNETILQVTDTDQSEYSPTPTPGTNHFSVIRVEPSQDNAQYLWRYPLNRENGGFYLFKELINVGYHCWLDSKHVAMFLVNNPFHKLAIGNIETQKVDVMLDNIGRTLVMNAEGMLLFIHKISNKFWYIKSYNPITHQFEIICRTIDGREDFVLLDDGSFLMGNGGKLFHLNPSIDKKWKEVYDFGIWDIENITRLKVFDNKLVLVATKAN